jgi:hypothetical protein
MVDISKAYPDPCNVDLLMQTVRTSYPEASQGDTGSRVHNIAPENAAADRARFLICVQLVLATIA